jgi:hypothetical protein
MAESWSPNLPKPSESPKWAVCPIIAHPFARELRSFQTEAGAQRVRRQGELVVPLVYFQDIKGRSSGRSLRDFLPLEKVTRMPRLRVEDEIDRSFDKKKPSDNYKTCLGRDWHFEDIEAAAEGLEGHAYKGRKHGSISEIILKALYDFEDVIASLFPNPPSQAQADFWISWQVRRHLAAFAFDVGESEEAEQLAMGNPRLEALDSELGLWRQLVAFTNHLKISPAAPTINRQERDPPMFDRKGRAEPEERIKNQHKPGSGTSSPRPTREARPEEQAVRAKKRLQWMEEVAPGESPKWWHYKTGLAYGTLAKYRNGVITNKMRSNRKQIADSLTLPFSEVPE